MSEVEREVLEVDVLFVGAGPACLAGALHLSQLIQKHDAAIDDGNAPGEKFGDIEIAVIEKAGEVGMHSLSGAVVDARALQELMPDFEEQGFPFEFKVDEDSVYHLTESGQWRFPITPPPMQNEGKYIASLNKITRWMAEKVEAAGVNVSAASRAPRCCTTVTRLSGFVPATVESTRPASRKATLKQASTSAPRSLFLARAAAAA